jgi:hypothetical protein
MIGNDQYLNARQEAPNFPGQDQTIHPGHPNIHYGDVGSKPLRLGQPLFPVSSLSDHFPASATFQHVAQTRPDRRKVINQQDSGRRLHNSNP